VSIHVHSLDGGKTTTVDSGPETDIYLPRIYWAGTAETVPFIRLNRLQNEMDLFHANATTGESKLVIRDTSATCVGVNSNDNLQYLKNGKGIIRTSEKDGYKHIYHHDMEGKLIRQMTTGNWEVSDLIGVDESSNTLYYLST